MNEMIPGENIDTHISCVFSEKKWLSFRSEEHEREKYLRKSTHLEGT
jgi:hypothetical protein